MCSSALTLALLTATVIGLVSLWPDAGLPARSCRDAGPGVVVLSAEVTSVPGSTDPTTSLLVEAIGRSSEIVDEEVQVEVDPRGRR